METFTFLDHFLVLVVILINFGQFWFSLEDMKKMYKSKMADQRGPPFENETQLLRHLTSSAHVVELKGRTFGRTTCPLSFAFIVFILS